MGIVQKLRGFTRSLRRRGGERAPRHEMKARRSKSGRGSDGPGQREQERAMMQRNMYL